MSHSISLIADFRLRRALIAPFFIALLLCPLALAAQSAGSLGIFDGQSDVGSVVPPGTAGLRAGHRRLHPHRRRHQPLVHHGRLPLRVEETLR